MNEKEIRYVSELGSTDRVVEGYAVVFETESVPEIGFVETIHRGAITEDTIKHSDVIAKLNHAADKVLARSRYGEGSLELCVDDIGLRYRFEAPNTALGDELLEYLKRGDLCQSSFAFTVADGGDKWSYKNGTTYRDIYAISALYDVSPVFTPAYAQTTCCKRFAEYDESRKALFASLDDKAKHIANLCD